MINIRNACLADVNNIATIRIKTWQTAYCNILPAEYLKNMSLQKSIEGWNRNLSNHESITLVAECHDKGVIGFICGGENRDKENFSTYDAEVYAVYILHEYSKQGIGTRLFKEISRKLIDHGYKSVIIWMLKGNSAENFYRGLSAEIVGEKQYTIGNNKYPVVALGINDLAKLFD